MSQYYSSSNDQYDDENDNPDHSLFQYDFYLSTSIDQITNWKLNYQNIQLSSQQIQKSLAAQFKSVIGLPQNLIRTVSQIRYVHFVYILSHAYQNLEKQYKQLYQQWAHSQNHRIQVTKQQQKQQQALDKRLVLLLNYTQYIDATKDLINFKDFSQDLDQYDQKICQKLVKIFPLVHNLYTQWRINHIVFLFKQNLKFKILVSNLGSSVKQHLKTLQTLAIKHSQIQKMRKIILELIQNNQVINHRHFIANIIKSNLQEKTINQFAITVKGIALHLYKSNFIQEIQNRVILFDLMLFNQKKELLKGEQHEKLWIQAFQKSFSNQKLLNIILSYAEPQTIMKKGRKKHHKHKIEGQMMHEKQKGLQQILFEQMQMIIKTLRQQSSVNGVNPYLFQILNFTLLIQFLTAFQQQSKQIFYNQDQGDTSVYQRYIEMLKSLKQLFLSFSQDIWIAPFDVFIPLNLKFFDEMSQDLRGDVKQILYKMVGNLNEDKLPQKAVLKLKKGVDQQKMKKKSNLGIVNDWQVVLQPVSRLEYLIVILNYLSQIMKGGQFVHLPDIIPKNVETSILFVKSLKLRLQHHKPTTQQEPYFKTLLDECNKYKVTTDFKWYKPMSKGLQQKEIEFNIQRTLPQSCRKILRKALNIRDNDILNKEINNKTPVSQIIQLLKYNRGLDIKGKSPQFDQMELFLMIDNMKNCLLINYDIFSMLIQDEVCLNTVHVNLTFYSIKQKQAKGSQIYQLIFLKFMMPYLSDLKHSQKQKELRLNYPLFFEPWIYKYMIIEVGSTIFQLLQQYQNSKQWEQMMISKFDLYKSFFTGIQSQHLKYQKTVQFVTCFVSCLDPNIPIKIYMQVCQILINIQNILPSIKDVFSMDVVLNQELIKRKQFIDFMFSQNQNNGNVSKGLMHHFIKNLDQYVLNGAISPTHTFAMIEKYKKSNKGKFDGNFNQEGDINQFISKIKQDPKKPFTVLLKAMKNLQTKYQDRDIMYSMFNQNQQKKEVQKQNLSLSWQIFKNILQNQQSKQLITQLKGMKFCKLTFMDKIISQLNTEQNAQAKKVFEKMLLEFGDHQDLIYFANKLNNLTLLDKEQKVLESLIIGNYDKDIQNEIIKKVLSNSKKENLEKYKNLKICSQNIVKTFTNDENKKQVESYLLLRLILINQRYPSQAVQNFIVSNIGKQKRVNIKIQQSYLINSIKEDLKQLPINIIEKIIFEGENYLAIISLIFEKLINLPSDHFNFYLNNQSIEKLLESIQKQKDSEQNQQQWQTDSQKDEQESQDEQQNSKSEKYKDSNKKQQKTTAKKQQQQQMQQNQLKNQYADQVFPVSDQQSIESNDDQNQDGWDQNRPSFLDCFTDGSQTLKQYKRFMQLREQIDIYIKTNYANNYLQASLSSILGNKQDPFIKEKSLEIVKILNHFQKEHSQLIVDHIPNQIYQVLRLQALGLEIKKNQQIRKIANIKKMKFDQNIFTDRQQSDFTDNDQNDSQDDDQQQQQESQWNQDDENNEQVIAFQENNLFNQLQSQKINQQQTNLVSLQQNFEQSIDNIIKQKVEEPIKSSSSIKNTYKITFNEQQIVKILQILVYQVLTMSQYTIRLQAVTLLFKQVIHSKLGKIFIQSILTVLRIDQDSDKFNNFIDESIAEKKQLLIPDLEKSINNTLYIMKQSQLPSKVNSKLNIKFRNFLHSSQTLIPIGHTILNKFDLPLQQNLLTLALIYIRKDPSIRSFIQDLKLVSIEQQEKMKKQKRTFLSKKKDLLKIIKQMYLHKCPSKAWQVFKDKFKFKAKGLQNLILCLQIYSKQLNGQITTLMKKIHSIQTNLKSNNVVADQNDISALRILKRKSTQQSNYHQFLSSKLTFQSQYHIYTNLINSYRDSVKLFYFIHNYNFKEYCQEGQNQDSEQIKLHKLRKIKSDIRNKILTNENLLNIVEMMYYLIDFLKNKFHGKIQQKKFNRLIHVPKNIIKTSLIILYSLVPTQKWRSQVIVPVQQFFKQYRFKQYKFKSLQQISQLFFGLLNIQSFCQNRFKNMIIPYLIKNPQQGIKVPLIFKAPEVPQDIDGPRIFITRQCSFDMAFYQLKSDAFLVQYHQQQGSDHGGMVRQFMMGWKGQGVGQQSYFIGKLLAISFKQGIPYGGYFDYSMAISITQSKTSMQLLKEADPKVYNSLKFIQQNDPEDLSLTFVAPKQIFGKVFMYQLKPNGSTIDLTQQNKKEYIQIYLEKYWYLGKQFELGQLRKGFYSIVPQQYAKIFAPSQLMQKIKGQQIIDCKKLKQRTKYEEGYTQSSPMIVWLWEILESFNQQQMNKFIQFITGSPKISLFHSNFEMIIQKVFDTERLPVAHTCFNTLDLPQYPNKEILQKKLLLAIFEGNDNFGIL